MESEAVAGPGVGAVIDPEVVAALGSDTMADPIGPNSGGMDGGGV